ncbi:putative zinc metalloprotease CT_072 [Waddlia chondrophila 2032/99]|uniref:Metalloprotease n=2 Tax=Waddlia chondrophila TaxID=71667 RepID=D6YUB9_WADCW|nr:site-2 protease family protein [Waddlia chondrophila]ADI37730.1 metalloprotease [Waddlia chondrophila WSU 86-1044]CCB90748.1 putative zinc metalloprotease CT_072 [Waddlia chondrophila 2032/99]
MFANLIYIVLAILGLSFLIFIHELGHYWMARRVGMRVETFAIGFGRPIYSWMRDGVKWQIGWLLFGGFVKIAGTDTDSTVDPYAVKDGFFGKGPWNRIKVAFMGPFVNLVFALLVFALLWAIGGRTKSFAEYTSKIGWVDPNSELYALGVRPGDEVDSYDEHPFSSYKDHLYASLLGDEEIKIKGTKIDYETGERFPFEYTVASYPNPAFADKKMKTTGILSSASYIIYDRLHNGRENPLPEGSPLQNSGIQYGDRILWVDGETVFSNAQLSELLNDGRVLMTIKRGNDIIHRRVPRVRAQELRPDVEFREEMIDWMYEAGLNSRRFQDLYAIPYNLTHDGVVEEELRFIDKADQKKAFPVHLFSDLEEPLRPGDRIIAVQGQQVKRSYEILRGLQTKQVQIIVARDSAETAVIPYQKANVSFNQNIEWMHLHQIADSIGTNALKARAGNLVLLAPVTPMARKNFPMSEETKAWYAAELLEKKQEIEKIEDPERRAQLLGQLKESQELLVLGIPNPQDRQVVYNPNPVTVFSNVAKEIGRTMQALFSGTLSPKYIAGPVGIVHMVQTTSSQSLMEALFWIGAISLNLGVLNLLPVPILDGGTIVFAFIEMVTGRRMKPKTLEKVVIVFAILLISFFLFLTYNDISRVFG